MKLKKTVFALKMKVKKICTFALASDVLAKADIKPVSLNCCIVG